MRADQHHTAPNAGHERQGKEWGDTTVQAVAIIPLTLLLIFAIIQFAIAWYAKAALTAAAEDGLRYVQTSSPDPTGRNSCCLTERMPKFVGWSDGDIVV